MVLAYDKWVVADMALTPDKVAMLWKMLHRHKTLFSDLTRNDPENFVRALTSRNSYWLEVRERGVLVGIIWFGDLHQVTDVTAHMVFFDRMPIEKKQLCREIVKWYFHEFPIQRITITPPEIYKMTIKLIEQIGFKREGRKENAVLLGGKWTNQLIYGMTRKRAEAL